jgi:hypothetical protein
VCGAFRQYRTLLSIERQFEGLGYGGYGERIIRGSPAVEHDQGRAGFREFNRHGSVLHSQRFFMSGGPSGPRPYRRAPESCVGGVIDARRMQTKRGRAPDVWSGRDGKANAIVQILVENRYLDGPVIAAQTISRQQWRLLGIMERALDQLSCARLSEEQHAVINWALTLAQTQRRMKGGGSYCGEANKISAIPG